MCFGIGPGCLLALIEVLPYICLVTVPLLGSFYGVETTYRISILLIIHSLLIECIPGALLRVLPVLNLMLFITLMYLPISLTPWPVVWLYDKILWLTEPVLMVAEVALLQNFIMRQSQAAVDEMEQSEDSTFHYKAAILLFSSLFYALAASLAYDIYSNAAPSQVLCLFVVICILIAVHNMMLMAHEGIISDCAFCSLVSITVLYIMVIETHQISTPLPQPLLWKQNTPVMSNVVDVFWTILHMSTDSAQRAIAFLKRFVSPFFLALLAIRLYGILFIVNKITRNFFQDKETDFDVTVQDFEEEEFSPWKSPVLLKVSIVFMLTQLSGHFLEEWSGQAGSLSWLVDVTKHVWPAQVLIGRLVQILAVNGFYMWRLYKAEDWTWNPWLTPS